MVIIYYAIEIKARASWDTFGNISVNTLALDFFINRGDDLRNIM